MSLQIYIYIFYGLCYFPPFGTKSYKSTNTNPYPLLCIEFVDYESFLGVGGCGVVLVGDFSDQISSHQGQDLHQDDNGINLLEVLKPH